MTVLLKLNLRTFRHLGEAKLPELKALQQMLHEVNPYVSYFNHAVDLMKEQGGIDIRMVIRANGGPDTADATFLLLQKLQYYFQVQDTPM